MERVKGIEPSSQAWEAHILPLNHTRNRSNFFHPRTTLDARQGRHQQKLDKTF